VSILSPVHIAFFAAIALLALGPKRFPEFTRALGNGIRGFREVLNGEPPQRKAVAEGGEAGEDAGESGAGEEPG
jgi:Sec-independent protein translocase protein TatA